MLPELETRGWSATVFLAVQALEEGRLPEVLGERALLRWSEAEQLVGAGWEIGSHTLSHPDLTGLNPARLTARAEVGCDRQTELVFLKGAAKLLAPKAAGRPPVRWCLHPWVNVREKLFGWETTATLAFRDELDDFLQTLNGKETLLAGGQAGLAAVAVSQAVYQSQRTGEAVKVAALS